MKKCNIGGQAVLEGVMMKSQDCTAIAVRRPDGTIEVVKEKTSSLRDKHKILGLPIIRGMVTFFETMVIGIKTLMTSAELYGDEEELEDYQPSKFEKFLSDRTGKDIEDIMIGTALVLALLFAVILFVIIPTTIASFLRQSVESDVIMNVIEGLIRLAVFLIYIVSISQIKDIRRVFEYHGAEHKTIHCYEHEEKLTVDNARKYTTLHPRCGTAFLLIVMVVSILVFSLLGWQGIFMRILTRMLLLPVISGIAYEGIRWAGKSESKLVDIIMYPGLMLQKLTTKEPDDQQLEVAIRAFLAVAQCDESEMEDESQVDGYTIHSPTEA